MAAPSWDRTPDPHIKSPLLYWLSKPCSHISCLCKNKTFLMFNWWIWLGGHISCLAIIQIIPSIPSKTNPLTTSKACQLSKTPLKRQSVNEMDSSLSLFNYSKTSLLRPPLVPSQSGLNREVVWLLRFVFQLVRIFIS